MANPVAFPNRPFNLRTNFWLVSQNIAGNQSKIGWQLWVDKTGYSPTSSGGAAHRWLRVDTPIASDIYLHENYGNGFNFVTGNNFLLASGETWFSHASDGTLTITIEADASFDILGNTPTLTTSYTAPTIPRASLSSFSAGTAFDVGTDVTINTNRAPGTSFTHTLQLWLYGGTSALETIATGVGASHAWNPVPASLATHFTSATSRQFFLRTITFNGGTQIGQRDTVFTLRAPSGMVPTISGLSASDDNPTVASIVGLFVQNLSILKATVNAAGVQGSTITARSFKMGATTAASGGVIPITGSGTVAVTASCTDSRSRTGSFSGSISVLSYHDPQFTSVLVRRSTAGGVVDDDGTSLRVDLNCAVKSLVNSTQRNSLTIKVFTRPYGGSTWTARNVINVAAGTVTYNSNFVVSGGANYPIDESFDVRVEINDKFKTAAAQTVIPTAAILMHWATSGVGVGKYWEQGALDVGGDIYQNGSPVDPVGQVTAWAGNGAPAGWLLCDGAAVSRTTYAALFAVIGTTYGAGNGSSTFNLPNLKGRVPVGHDSAQSEFDTLGETGGAKTHTHTMTSAWAQIRIAAASTRQIVMRRLVTPSWTATHALTPNAVNAASDSGAEMSGAGIGGSADAESSLQPYLTVNFIIKAL